ncbi:hypothetical protein FQA39_LY05999 [Lamprigera yunnana]|nr:hypothetical protein FQA39_LY05999 [Lamprigera yunnana]
MIGNFNDRIGKQDELYKEIIRNEGENIIQLAIGQGERKSYVSDTGNCKYADHVVVMAEKQQDLEKNSLGMEKYTKRIRNKDEPTENSSNDSKRTDDSNCTETNAGTDATSDEYILILRSTHRKYR